MFGWETVLAIVGGLLVGLGLGITIGRRQEDSLLLERAQLDLQLRRTVVPVLEQRIAQLAISKPDRTHDDDRNASRIAVELATLLQRFEDQTALPYTDTVQLGSASLSSSRPTERGDT